MKKIELTQGKVALVDDSDYEELNQHKWHASKYGRSYYALRREYTPKRKNIYMHREVLGIRDSPDKIPDHISGDGLDNQKKNLRICSHKENTRNSRLSKNNTSGYKGVSWLKREKRWHSQIVVNRKLVYIGNYFCLMKAVRAYDEAATKYFGDFANLNFPREDVS